MFNLSDLPSSPGIYIYRNNEGEIIYVGKAINLKKRVSQYFQRDDALGPKTKTLVSQINSIDTKIVGSEIEALILEASYIKKYRPKYNSLLKDDRSYQFICITRETFPRIYSVFGSQADTTQLLYGPFPSGSAVKSLLKTLRRIFPYYGQKKHPKTRCLYCHLGICPGPTPNKTTYRHHISLIKKILSGKFKLVQRLLKKEMHNASELQQYELALQSKHQLESLNYIVSGWHNLNNLFEAVELPEDSQSSAIAELTTTLQPYLNIHKIRRIECFDISQMVDKHFVGSMTVWQNGHLDNSSYRQFKIKNNLITNNTSLRLSAVALAKAERASGDEAISLKPTSTPNDPLMIKQVVSRRLQHPEWGTPDLIVVDGGKPQVSAVSSLRLSAVALAKAEGALGDEAISPSLPHTSGSLKNISIIGLAKKEETIVIKQGQNWVEIKLPTNSKALLLLELLRNEAHRFANRYRKKLMTKSIV